MGERLTLCTLVRDEEALLPACLASVRDVVDGIVVVDTGSTDRSVEIARGAGARVLRREWGDDFAAARNAALAEVTEGWVLVLDADERLVEGSGRGLRAAMAAGRLDWGLLALHEADSLEADPGEVAAGRGRLGEPMLAPRLMRRTRELSWRGLVAEEACGWREAGRRAGSVEASIVHYGAIPESRRNLERAGLRLRLLQRRCELEPGDPRVRARLARERLRSGDEAGGRADAARAWHLLSSGGDPARAAWDGVLVATLHAFLELAEGRLESAAEVLARCGDLGWTHPNLDLLAGTLLEALALGEDAPSAQAEALSAARAAFERCLERSGEPSPGELLPGATSWAARTRLATVDLLCGRPDEALQGFERALGENPQLSEAHLGRLEALLDLGMPGEALQGLEPWLPGGSPDAWTLAAAAAGAVGCPDDARLFGERARDAAAGRSWASRHRALRLEAIRDRVS